jgi:hypothetical protein
MKIRGVSRVVVRAGTLVVLAASSANADMVWRRASDWVPGTVAGSTMGNPGNVNGAPVWRYETTQGGGLGSVNPWYKQPTSLMTWDPAWYATGWGVWSHGDNLNPPVLAGRLIHNVAASTWGDIPLVRWMNPLGNGVALDIAGTLTVNWNGVNGLGRPVNVDVVIAKYTAASNTTSILFSDTVSKPNPFPSVGDSVFLPVNLSQIAMNAGDSIIISHRGQNPVGPLGAWVNLYDNLSLSAVPAPGSFALLSLAGLVAVRRKRR